MNHVREMGGPQAVEAVMGAFVDRCFADFIIGFMFEGKDRDRIVKHETEMARRMLGDSSVRYTGRPLSSSHKPLKINQGQFRRRMAILGHVLRDHNVPEHIVALWLAHQESFRHAVTIDIDCV